VVPLHGAGLITEVTCVIRRLLRSRFQRTAARSYTRPPPVSQARLVCLPIGRSIASACHRCGVRYGQPPLAAIDSTLEFRDFILETGDPNNIMYQFAGSGLPTPSSRREYRYFSRGQPVSLEPRFATVFSETNVPSRGVVNMTIGKQTGFSFTTRRGSELTSSTRCRR